MIRVPHTACNGDVHLAADDLGGAGGDPLLLIMGLGVSRFWWPDGLVAALIDAGFSVASFDGRDAGGSTHFDGTPAGNPVTGLLRRRPPAYTAEDMADDTVAVLDALGWQRAHLFGISQGGLVAQRTALRHPERVHTVTSYAAVPSDARGAAVLRYVRLPFLARLTRMRHPAGRDGDLAAGLDLLRAVASPGYPFDEQDARLRVKRELDAGLPSGVRDSGAQARQTSAPWHGPRLHRLRAPLLVLHGEHDPLIRPVAGRRIAASVPGARYVELPGTGHDLPREIWPTVVREIRSRAG
ncbi:alpha/beta fold hydrolase [Actinoplanes xinjiangensis]|uniref:Pimeloyl-ACP methyl ester carboxylesterase n=1 Tax=Actinoplanes xinjiangensis TaxID=512350 RepID=A0A316FH35_9ACTN|nr:alpha/beta hydrolase [Actinoplanes xinjiangensis]PWK47016.1 pimeloyl-ACP methyl ester carboxylesterase [Actinoplanes xinjiangensis]GIF40175.1 alpha/beta hydrolase [Actinoplanes xinjiangensis]